MYEQFIYLKPRRLQAFVFHTAVTGKTGSGKSMACEYILENHYGKGYKLWDIFDQGRFENSFYSLPSCNPKFIKSLRDYADSIPRAYPNDVYVICGQGLLDRKIWPKNVRIVSFDTKDVNISDAYYLFGQSKNIFAVIAQINYLFGENVTLDELGEILSMGTFRKKRFNPRWLNVSPMTKGLMLRNLRRLQTSGIFSQKAQKIDFQKIAEDTDTITSFSTALLDEEMEPIVYGMILKKIFELKKAKLVKAAQVVYIRELSNFMHPRWAFPYFYYKRMMREGRDILGGNGLNGMMLVDTQTAEDIKEEILSQFGYYITLKTNRSVAEKILKIQDIPPHILNRIPNFRAGQAIIATGNSWLYGVQFPATRHRHKEEGEDVIQILCDKFGSVEYNFDDLMEKEEPIGMQRLRELEDEEEENDGK